MQIVIVDHLMEDYNHRKISRDLSFILVPLQILIILFLKFKTPKKKCFGVFFILDNMYDICEFLCVDS